MGIVRCYKNYKSGIIDLTGKELVPPIYDQIFNFNYSGYVKVEVGTKHGLIRLSDWKEIIPPIYDAIKIVGSNAFIVGNGKVMHWQTLTKLQLNNSVSYGDEFLENGKWGVIDSNKMPLLPIIYDEILPNCHNAFEDGFVAAVRKGNIWNFIDGKNNDNSKLHFLNNSNANNSGWKIVRYYNDNCVLNTEDQNKLISGYDDGNRKYIGYGFFKVSQYNKVAIIGDNNFNTGYKYDEVAEFNKLLRVRILDKCAFVNKDGKEVTGFQYDTSGYENYGTFGDNTIGKINGKIALLNLEGKLVTPFLLDSMQTFPRDYYNSKLAFVMINGK